MKKSIFGAAVLMGGILVIEGEFLGGKDGKMFGMIIKKGVARGGFRQKITFRRVNYYNWSFEEWGGGIIFIIIFSS